MTLFVGDGKSAIDAVGGGAASPFFGDGVLGDVTLSSYLESSGDLHYNTLVVDPGGDIGVVAKRKLVIRTIGNLDVNAGRSIHADGRGWSGQAGGTGGSRTITGPTVFVPESPGVLLPDAPYVAGAGGGGGAGGPCFPGAGRVPSGDGGSTVRSTLGGSRREFSTFDTRQDTVAHAPAIVQEIYNLSIPAGTLLVPGDYLDVDFALDFADINATGTVSYLVRWGGALVVDLNTITTFAGNFTITVRGRIYFLTPTTQSCVFTATVQNDASSPVNTPPYVERYFATNTSVNSGALQTITFNSDQTNIVSDFITGRAGSARLVSPTSLVPVVGGAGEVPVAGPSGNAGAGGPALSAIEIARATADYAALARAFSIFGAGGAGGGGGSGFDTAPTNTAGAPGAVTGPAGFGDGGDGVYNNPSDFGGSGGAGGAGGGHLVIWCGGDLTVGAGARISAKGGNGGAGSSTGNAGGGEGGGGGGAGGGFVGVFHAGTLTNSGSIAAGGGTGGIGSTGFGQDAGDGGAGAAGIVVIQKVA